MATPGERRRLPSASVLIAAAAASALLLVFGGGCRSHKPTKAGSPKPAKRLLAYRRVPILCYHQLADKPGLYVETPARFEQQMAFLAQQGYQAIRVADLVAYLNGERDLPPKPVIITFDDGRRSAYTEARPILHKHGFTASLFLIVASVGGKDFLTWEQVRELHAAGYEIGSHTLTHAMLTRRRQGESEGQWRPRISEELVKSKARIEKEIGDQVIALAYPNGLYDDFAVVNSVQKAGYQAALTIDRGPADQRSDPLLLPRQQVIGVNSMERFRQQVAALPLHVDSVFPGPGHRVPPGGNLFTAQLRDQDVPTAALGVDIDGQRQTVELGADRQVEFRPRRLSAGGHNLRMSAKVPSGLRDRSWVFLVEGD